MLTIQELRQTLYAEQEEIILKLLRNEINDTEFHQQMDELKRQYE